MSLGVTVGLGALQTEQWQQQQTDNRHTLRGLVIGFWALGNCRAESMPLCAAQAATDACSMRARVHLMHRHAPTGVVYLCMLVMLRNQHNRRKTVMCVFVHETQPAAATPASMRDA